MTSELKLEIINALDKGYTLDQIYESLENITYDEIKEVLTELEENC